MTVVYTHATQERVVLVEAGHLGSHNGIPHRFFRLNVFDAEKGKITAELKLDDLRALLEAAELYAEENT